MLKRVLLASTLGLAMVGIGGAAAQADHTTRCSAITGTEDAYLWVTGVTGPEDCTGTGCDVETGACTEQHCSLWLVVVGSCE